MTPTPVFPQTPFVKSTPFLAVSACTTRAPTATAGLAAANIFEITPTSLNGRRIDSVVVSGASSSLTSSTAACLVGIWLWDGTTAHLIDEILVDATATSSVSPTFSTSKCLTIKALPASFKLFASVSVTLLANTTALVVTVVGGDY